MKEVFIIGAGAAGCFCAIELKRQHPDVNVTVLEKGSKALAKVALTGGGRCNLTNSFRDVKSVESVYPRGGKLMKRLLREFSNDDTMLWFEHEGVRLTTQDDQCVFPVSQNAMEIVDTLLRLMRREGVRLLLNSKVTDIKSLHEDGYEILTDKDVFHADSVIVTVGGHPKDSGFSFLRSLNLKIISPIPALFTFQIDDNELHKLMGTVVEPVTARLCGTKFQQQGALLITHWGMSGPAILKLSSHAARHLAEHDYKAEVSINWLFDMTETEALDMLKGIANANPFKQLSTAHPTLFNQRHWLYILYKVGLPPEKRWQEVGPKQMNRLASMLTSDIYRINGRGQFKEEFVTCGGVSLECINKKSLEAIDYKGLYFAGEVTDVDAVTGGFNLQAAWSMAMCIARHF